MEHVLYSQIMSHLDRNIILVHYQHGFWSGHLCEPQLINTIDNIVWSLKDKTQADPLILDFQKAWLSPTWKSAYETWTLWFSTPTRTVDKNMVN